jgi:hypothetical protein
MPNSHEFNKDAIDRLHAHIFLMSRLCDETMEIIAATQEVMAQSRALAGKADVALANHNFGTRCLWPPYR